MALESVRYYNILMLTASINGIYSTIETILSIMPSKIAELASKLVIISSYPSKMPLQTSSICCTLKLLAKFVALTIALK